MCTSHSPSTEDDEYTSVPQRQHKMIASTNAWYISRLVFAGLPDNRTNSPERFPLRSSQRATQRLASASNEKVPFLLWV